MNSQGHEMPWMDLSRRCGTKCKAEAWPVLERESLLTGIGQGPRTGCLWCFHLFRDLKRLGLLQRTMPSGPLYPSKVKKILLLLVRLVSRGIHLVHKSPFGSRRYPPGTDGNSTGSCGAWPGGSFQIPREGSSSSTGCGQA